MAARLSIATWSRCSTRPQRRCATFHPSRVSDLALMGFSILAALIGIGVASWWYLKSTDIPEQLAERFADLYRILVHKYYVDEFL